MSIRFGWFLGIANLCAIAFSPNCASAQITPDGTLPNNSIVTPNGSTLNITGGTQAGGNLFHSFSEFSVRNGGAATFNNALDIQNIISRVTGGSVSQIDGLIRASGTANLFLINPNGIVFGRNASLNVGGSFVASTASSLKFADGFEFKATAPQTTPLLTISVPIGLQFGTTTGNIVNQSRATNSIGLVTGLQVRSGNTLALVGGDVKLDRGSLQAPGGRVELGGLSGAGTVGIDTDVATLRFPDTVARANVYLDNRAEVNVRASGGGSIAINAQNLNLTQGSKLEAGIASGLASGDTKAGNIEINTTGNVSLNGEGSGAYNQVKSNAIGNAGNINVTAGSVSVTNGGELNTSTGGQGNAGNVNVNARDTVSFVGESPNNISSRIYSRVEKNALGQGGDIYIKTGSLLVSDGAFLGASTLGIGDAGNVTIDAHDTVRFDGVGPRSDNFFPSGAYTPVSAGATGKGGNVNITTGSLFFTNGAQLKTSTEGHGNAGNVNINARDTVSFIGESPNNSSSRVYSRVEKNAVGQGGDIYIKTGSLLVSDGAFLGASTFGIGDAGNVTIDAHDTVQFDGVGPGDNFPSGAYTPVSAGARGKGGNININATTLSLTDGAQLLTRTASASNTQAARQGDAGNINVNVTGAVDIAGETGTGIFSYLGKGWVGSGGNITIDAGSFSLRDGAELEADTNGQGNAGNVTVRVRDSVSLANGSISSRVQPSAVGKGGNININATTLSLTDGAQLLTLTASASNTQPAGQRDAGNVNVNVTGAVDIAGMRDRSRSGIFSYLGTGAVGNGGNITIDAGSFSLRDGAQLAADTNGQGNAGNVTVRVHDSVSLANGSISSRVQPSAVGKGGNININATTLSLTDGAQLLTRTASASNTQPAGQRDAGNVNVNVTGAVDIAGMRDRSRSGIFSYLGTGAVGNGGNITIDSGSFSLRDGAQLAADTNGQGNAGNVTVRVHDSVSLANSTISSRVQPFAVGKAGNIDINAATLSLTNSARLQTFTASASNTQPAGQGDAGNLNVNVTGAVDIAGGSRRFPSGIFSYLGKGSVGSGGNITIDAGSFSLRDGAQLAANTNGQGNAGTIKVNAADFFTISGSSSNVTGIFVNSQSPTGTTGDIFVTSPRVTLNNSGTLNARSASRNGGDINLQTDLLLLRRGAQISTTAGTDGAGGNGGNITINTPSGFIVAGARENNDITANAFSGSGGRVTINATGIYGMTVRTREDLVRLLGTNLEPQLLPTNDITAISQTSPTLNGTVTVNTPDVDPNRGLVNLPTVPLETEVSQVCQPRTAENQSSFVITGRGGLPPNPRTDLLSGDAVQVDWVTLNPNSNNRTPTVIKSPTPTPPQPIIEATGWVRNQKGEVVLTANPSTVTPHSPWITPASCNTKT
jgi:filamentous hemagglutinin family protein